MPRTPTFRQDPPPGFVWADEASRLTGRAIETLYKDRQKGHENSDGPKSVTIGRKAAWRVTDIEAWLDAQTNPEPAPKQQRDSRPPEPRRAPRKRPAAKPAALQPAA